MSDTTTSHPGLDEERLTQWLSAQLPDVRPPLSFHRAAHGYSNLTYRVEDAAGRSYVVRRPPIGPLLPSAHDMVREHRILAALAPTGIPVPRPLALCTDDEVTGAPFFVMEHHAGYVIADRSQGGALDEPGRRTASLSLIRVLADLHAVDVDMVGLGDLGRREAYAARQVRRWRRQWEGSRTEGVPAVERVAQALESAVPQQHEVSIVHGDYRLDNVILDDAGQVRAVIDWELCTLGDPLADLGLLLVYWAEAADGEPVFGDPATVLAGFLTRHELVAAYAEASGNDLSALGYYYTLGYWKLAIIVQGIYRRWLENPVNGGARAASLGPSVGRLADAALAAATQAKIL